MALDLYDLEFDTRGWRQTVDRRDARSWTNDVGDTLGVHYFAIPPDIPAALDRIDTIRAFYRGQVTQAGGGLVELERADLAGLDAFRLILKIPQERGGMIYVGSITVPRRELSFVVRAQCVEHGPTGMREALVMSMIGDVEHDELGMPVGWAADPYDPTITGGIQRNLAEDSRWDDLVPDHPLSRLRQILTNVESTIRPSDRLRATPPFTGEPPEEKKRWWNF